MGGPDTPVRPSAFVACDAATDESKLAGALFFRLEDQKKSSETKGFAALVEIVPYLG
jgi:hypothetical protein